MEHGFDQATYGSWLSLVAETAGVSGATIARVELHSVDSVRPRRLGRRSSKRPDESSSLPVRAVVQVRDAQGAVVGATYWYGNQEDLARGVAVDFGCDLHASRGSQIIAWIDDQQTICSARQALAPQHASQRPFESFKAMKLMLRKAPRNQGGEPLSAEAA